MAYPIDVTSSISDVYPSGHLPTGRHLNADSSHRSVLSNRAHSVLKAAATGWFAVAALGQLMFVVYLFGFYGLTALEGRFAAWNQVFPQAHVPGDGVHNVVVGMHLAFAALITCGGLIQLTTGVRRRLPRFHRWNGRVYLVSASVMALGGLYMLWSGDGVGDMSLQIALGVNALLIMLCAFMVLRCALARRFAAHRRWALRLFLAVSGVWFFRIGLTFWIMVNQGPAGFDPKTFTGPALTVIAFAQYLLPLTVLQLYFYAQDSAGSRARIAMVGGLVGSSLLTAAGVVAASMMLWLPHLQ